MGVSEPTGLALVISLLLDQPRPDDVIGGIDSIPTIFLAMMIGDTVPEPEPLKKKFTFFNYYLHFFKLSLFFKCLISLQHLSLEIVDMIEL